MANRLLTETWAIRDGLITAKDIGFDSILVELGASAIVNLFRSPSDQSPILSPIINECRMLAWSFRRIQVHHIYREANGVADFLTKLVRDECDEFKRLDRSPVGWGSCFCLMLWGVISLELLTIMMGMPSLLTCSKILFMK